MTHAPAPFVPRTVAVLGAGAVGSYFGAMLARAGLDVLLIGRPAHVDAIVRDGLRVLQDEREWSAGVRAAVDPLAARAADIVLVTVKTPDTAAAARMLSPHLRADARVVSLQNGVDNATRIAAVLAQPVYAAVVYVGCHMEGPGRVRHTGRGDLVIGVPRALATRGDPAGDLRALAAMFERAGVACPTSPDIEAALWTKLTLNCAFNAVSALGNARYGTMAANPLVRPVMEEAVRETVAQDMQRDKPTEIDALNGLVAQRGAEQGIPTPVNRTLHALVKLREQERAPR
jgi:2-dehydropantoate 2-reductase